MQSSEVRVVYGCWVIANRPAWAGQIANQIREQDCMDVRELRPFRAGVAVWWANPGLRSGGPFNGELRSAEFRMKGQDI